MKILCLTLWGTSTFFSLMAQTVKNLPAMQETRVQLVDQEDSLEKGMATHSSILAWRIPWTEEPGGLQFTGLQRVGHDWATNIFITFLYFYFVFPGKRTPNIKYLSFHLEDKWKFKKFQALCFFKNCFSFANKAWEDIYLFLPSVNLVVQTVKHRLCFLSFL